MSRSYKKTPYCGLPKDKEDKRYANRRLRRKKLTSDLQHKSYRKDMCSWNICDYQEVGTSFEKYWSWVVRRWHQWCYRFNDDFPNRDECYREWYSMYKRK
jgi:hypothetical protein